MQTYRSAWVNGPLQISMCSDVLRKLSPDEVLVKIKACGICGTDIHFFKDFPARKLTPLGHEVSGLVAAVGECVVDLPIGTSVVVQNNIACGRCEACLNRNPAACSSIQTYMNDQAGLGEYLIVPRAMVIPFEGLDYPKAALAEPITVALDLCKEADIQLGDDVLIIGPGIIGLSCIRICRLRGAGRIVVVAHSTDSLRGSYRKDVALKLGADLVIDSDASEWKTKLKESFPRLFNRVIVTAPPQTLSDGIEMAGFHGQIVFDGIDFQHDEVIIHANDFHFAKKKLIASHAIPNWGFPLALKLLQKEPLMSALLLTHTYTFDSLEKAFAVFGDRNEKVIKPVVLFD